MYVQSRTVFVCHLNAPLAFKMFHINYLIHSYSSSRMSICFIKIPITEPDRTRVRPRQRRDSALLHCLWGQRLFANGGGCLLSSMRHWKCPCDLLQQPAALQQKHQYFKSPWDSLLLPYTEGNIHTAAETLTHFFFLLVTCDILSVETEREREKKNNMSSQAKIQTHFSLTTTSLQLVTVQNT